VGGVSSNWDVPDVCRIAVYVCLDFLKFLDYLGNVVDEFVFGFG
jgi:hypothetical protein